MSKRDDDAYDPLVPGPHPDGLPLRRPQRLAEEEAEAPAKGNLAWLFLELVSGRRNDSRFWFPAASGDQRLPKRHSLRPKLNRTDLIARWQRARRYKKALAERKLLQEERALAKEAQALRSPTTPVAAESASALEASAETTASQAALTLEETAGLAEAKLAAESAAPSRLARATQLATKELGIKRPGLAKTALKRLGWAAAAYVGTQALIGSVTGFIEGKLTPILTEGKMGSTEAALSNAAHQAGSNGWEGFKELSPGRQGLALLSQGRWGAALGSFLLDGASLAAFVGASILAPTAVGLIAGTIAIGSLAIAAWRSPVIRLLVKKASTAQGRQELRQVSGLLLREEGRLTTMPTQDQKSLKTLAQDLRKETAANALPDENATKPPQGLAPKPQEPDETTLAVDPTNESGSEGQQSGGKSRGGKKQFEQKEPSPRQQKEAEARLNPILGGAFSRLALYGDKNKPPQVPLSKEALLSVHGEHVENTAGPRPTATGRRYDAMKTPDAALALTPHPTAKGSHKWDAYVEGIKDRPTVH